MIAISIRRFLVTTIIGLSLVYLLLERLNADNSDEYHESNRQVSKVSVSQSDTYLQVAIFVQLNDNAVQRPKLYYYQVRQVFLGMHKVEAPGGLWSSIFEKRAFLYVPISDQIKDYLFLVRKPIPKEVKVDGRTKTEYDWTDWQLLQVPAKVISADKPLVIPPFDEIVEKSAQQKKLLDELRALYEVAHAKSVMKMNTPITHETKVPWYAK